MIEKPYPYSDVPSVMHRDALRLEDLTQSPAAQIELEIGFGKGRFILSRAMANPEVAFVGLETRRKWVHLVNERANKRKIENLRVWLGDAKTALPRVQTEQCLSRVFIQFPDPWWKKRHEKRMVVTPELLGELARLLKDNGDIFIQTDVDFRAETYLKTLLENADFLPGGDNGTPESNPFGSRTLREVQCEEVGLPIFRILFTRRPRS